MRCLSEENGNRKKLEKKRLQNTGAAKKDEHGK